MAPDVFWRFSGWVKSLLPDSQHPAASQPTPYNLNRWVLLSIYVFHVVVTACDYLGWGPISAMLFRSGAFLWECTPEEQLAGLPVDTFACLEQNSSVQALFSCCYASHFIATAAAGFLIDFAGPKVTALLGSALSLSSWALLGACSEKFRALFPAFIMMGAGAGMTYLPMLSIVNLFPGSFGFSLTIMGSGASLSLVTPSMLKAINEAGLSFKWVCWGYAICGPLVGFIIVSLFLPLDGFIEVDLFVLVPTMQSPHSSAVGASDAQQGNMYAMGNQVSRLNWGSTGPSHPPPHDAAALSTVTDNDYFQPFQKEACTFLYASICLYFAICSLAVVYYQKTASIFLVREAVNALEITSPFSTIPCIIVGRMADYYSIVSLMMFLNMTGAISFVLATFKTFTTSILSVCFFSAYIAIFTSQVFIFVKAFFTSVHFGKLVGIAVMTGGILSLSIEVLYDKLSNHPSDGSCDPALWIIFGIVMASYVILIPMRRAARRKQIDLNDQKREAVGVFQAAHFLRSET